MSAYDFWLLDLDGTLVDIERSYAREVFGRVGDRVGRSFTDREIEQVWHGFGGVRDERLRSWGIDATEFWDVFHEVEAATARAEATFLYDDAAAFVNALDVPVGVVTHCQPYLTTPVLHALDISDWFDTVVCCDADLGWKPDPAPVRHAMANLGVTPSDGAGEGPAGALVGDGPHDVAAGWNAGLDGIHVERHGPAVRGRHVIADRQVRSLTDLVDLTGLAD